MHQKQGHLACSSTPLQNFFLGRKVDSPYTSKLVVLGCTRMRSRSRTRTIGTWILCDEREKWAAADALRNILCKARVSKRGNFVDHSHITLTPWKAYQQSSKLLLSIYLHNGLSPRPNGRHFKIQWGQCWSCPLKVIQSRSFFTLCL